MIDCGSGRKRGGGSCNQVFTGIKAWLGMKESLQRETLMKVRCEELCVVEVEMTFFRIVRYID